MGREACVEVGAAARGQAPPAEEALAPRSVADRTSAPVVRSPEGTALSKHDALALGVQATGAAVRTALVTQRSLPVLASRADTNSSAAATGLSIPPRRLPRPT